VPGLLTSKVAPSFRASPSKPIGAHDLSFCYQAIANLYARRLSDFSERLRTLAQRNLTKFNRTVQPRELKTSRGRIILPVPALAAVRFHRSAWSAVSTRELPCRQSPRVRSTEPMITKSSLSSFIAS